MKNNVSLVALLVLSTAGGSAFAKTLKIAGHSPKQVQKWCGNTGVFWPAGGTTATYGCMRADGSGIVCSGVTDKQKQTCDIWGRTLPPRLVERFRELSVGENKAATQ